MRNPAGIVLISLTLAIFATPQGSLAQQPATARSSRMLLIMPFENTSSAGATGLDWIGEAFPEVVGDRLSASSLFLIGRNDRLLAFDRLGLPASAKPSRATIYQVAQELDADYVLMGDYRVEANLLTVRAQIMDLGHLRLSPEMKESGPLTNLITIQTALAWDALHALTVADTTATAGAGTMIGAASLPKDQFASQFPPIRLDALENYIRGVLATSDPEKIKHFREAVRLDPTHTLAILQLGKTFYQTKDYESAMNWLAKVPANTANSNEAQFYLGLASFYAGQMAKAAAAFQSLSSRLPLNEVDNNLGVALSRLGDRRARGYFEKSAHTDSSDPDYHFNLAVELYREGQTQDAIRELRAVLAFHPDGEAKAFLDAISAGPQVTIKLPWPRIKRNYDESSFRQLALEIENTTETRLLKSGLASHVAFHVQRGQELLSQGLTAEAEKQFREAAILDPNHAGAHAGLSRALESKPDKTGARKEAQNSLRLAPSAEAYLVLARLDLAENSSEAARQNIERALALDPANAAAIALKHDIATGPSGSQIPERHPERHY